MILENQKPVEILKQITLDEIEVQLAKLDESAGNSLHEWSLRLNPKTGLFSIDQHVGACCSQEEYFSEFGALSEMTLTTKTGFTPGPSDGYEWEDSEEGSWIRSSDGTKFQEFGQVDELVQREFPSEYSEELTLDECWLIAKANGWVRFTVSSIPVNCDFSYDAREIFLKIQERISKIEKE